MTRSTDSVFEELGNQVIGLTIIDVEGLETEAVQSAVQTLTARRIRVVDSDFHGLILTPKAPDPREVDARPRDFRYVLEPANLYWGCKAHSAQS